MRVQGIILHLISSEKAYKNTPFPYTYCSAMFFILLGLSTYWVVIYCNAAFAAVPILCKVASKVNVSNRNTSNLTYITYHPECKLYCTRYSCYYHQTALDVSKPLLDYP